MFATVFRGAFGWRVCIPALLIALLAASGSAGTLITAPGSFEHGGIYGTIAWVDLNGNGIYDGPGDDYYSYTVDLEYAVFHGSAPSLGLTYPGSTIYAYQFFSEPGVGVDAINTLTVGLYSKNYVSFASWAADPADPMSHTPTGVSINGNSVLWSFDYDPYAVWPGQQSDILYFVSPFDPTTATCGFAGGTGVDLDGIPSPVPEPGTGLLMLIGACAFLFVAVGRRVCRLNKK